MKKHYKLATIVVNYKSDERTVTYIKEELLKKCSVPQIIVVVNNGAADSSSQMLGLSLNAVIVKDIILYDMDSQIYVIHSVENLGFAGGNNLGVDFVKRHFEVDFLLFSNNDIHLCSVGVIEKLIQKMETLADVGIIGPKVVGMDGHCQSPNDYVPFWKELVGVPWERFIPFLHLKHLNQNQAKEGYYFRVMGSFFLMKFDDFMHCGMMDSCTFLFYEEAILSERLRLINKRVYYYPAVAVLHDHGFSINRSPHVMKQRDYMFESALYFYKTYKHVSKISIIVVKCLHYIYRNLQYAKRCIRKKI